MFGTTRVTMEFYYTHIFQNVGGLKAGTHWPKRCSSEAFGETRTRSGTNMFGVFSCVGSFQSSANVAGSDSSCEVWGGGPWDVWAIGFSDWLCARSLVTNIPGLPCSLIKAPPHTAQTQTNSQLLLSDHSVASRLTRLAEKLHWTHRCAVDVPSTP